MAAVQQVFAKLDFRTLLQRVGKLAGADAGASAEPAGAASLAPSKPEAKNLLDEELGDWLEKADRPAIMIAEGMAGFEVGLATADSTVLINWQPGGRDYALFEAWLASDAPKVCWDAKQQMRLAAKAGATLADAAFRFLGEQMPEGDPNQLIPDEGSVARPEAVSYTHLDVYKRQVEGLAASVRELAAGTQR